MSHQTPESNNDNFFANLNALKVKFSGQDFAQDGSLDLATVMGQALSILQPPKNIPQIFQRADSPSLGQFTLRQQLASNCALQVLEAERKIFNMLSLTDSLDTFRHVKNGSLAAALRKTGTTGLTLGEQFREEYPNQTVITQVSHSNLLLAIRTLAPLNRNTQLRASDQMRMRSNQFCSLLLKELGLLEEDPLEVERLLANQTAFPIILFDLQGVGIRLEKTTDPHINFYLLGEPRTSRWRKLDFLGIYAELNTTL